MEKSKIQYAELQVHIRLLYILIGFAGFSALLHAFSLNFRLSIEANQSVNYGAALIATFGPMRQLKQVSIQGYWGAIVSMASLPLFYVYQFIAFPQLNISNSVLLFYWPLVNGSLFICCILIMLNKPTYEFYANKH